ncbi:uncharacterized protein CTRU02_215133 [Colletotrichum truncatum]|uniref:Uncharacterized protein n=1 Tax=Colletotrichum truncatum TaxID=5467 RepID=A0ACC3YDM1_COLTU|nr:uncharacterized protein CTRU02_13682 [Colletotrichum truncatum]KAF6783030.1 hypothetical protein CTRU02_13682 [Colletotrichum truncatum]
MDNFMNMTEDVGHSPELQRLRDLNAVYFDALDHKLAVAPVNLDEPGKSILDSGTADGIWLRDLRSTVTAEHEYFGSDIEGELFPSQPDGIKYFQHSFKDLWPQDLPSRPTEVVRNLATLAKPGSWVQLQEMNAFTAPPNGPAITDFARMASENWTGIGVGDFANELASYLREGGLKNVQKRRVMCRLGKSTKPELREQSVNGVTGPIEPLVSFARSVKLSFTGDERSAMKSRVKAELKNNGGIIEVVIAFGQRE